MPMQVDQRGKDLFKEWEGLVTHEYLDSGGAPTIGIGHLLTRSERTSGKIVIQGQALDYRNGLTEQQCWDLLGQDLVVHPLNHWYNLGHRQQEVPHGVTRSCYK
jgi:lysozyme